MVLLVVGALWAVPDSRAAPELARGITFGPHDRVLVLAPHPDDESLACAGVLQAALAMGLPVRVLWLTHGDNNEWSFMVYRRHPVVRPSAFRAMGEVRHDEAVAAMKALGIESSHLVFLGYPDYGTLDIWNRHWGAKPPYRSMLTRVTAVPYADAFRRGAAHTGQDILADLTANIREFRPTQVFCSHPADLNRDHQALYLFTRVALWNLEAEMKPQLHPYLVHAPQWPRPTGLHMELPMTPPAGLDNDSSAIAWSARPLTEAQMLAKQSALRAHRSQMDYSRKFMQAFVRSTEVFGDFEAITLADAPAASARASARSAGPSEVLSESERARFVGVEQVYLWHEADELVVSILFSRPLARGVSASVSVFGWREDRPFEDMPKVRVELGEMDHRVLDQGVAIPGSIVALKRQANRLTVRIPLRLLGDPERALISVHIALGERTLDSPEWRVVDLSGAQAR